MYGKSSEPRLYSSIMSTYRDLSQDENFLPSFLCAVLIWSFSCICRLLFALCCFQICLSPAFLSIHAPFPAPPSMPVPKPSSVPIPLHSGVVASRAWSHTPIQQPSWPSAYAYTWSCPYKWGPLPPQLSPISLTLLPQSPHSYSKHSYFSAPLSTNTLSCASLQCFPEESVGAD